MSFGQVSALSILDLKPGINGAQLARESMVSAQAMTAVLRTLTEKRLLERRAHPTSLRADAWHVTARGLAVLARARGIFGTVMARMLSPLTVRERREFERYLRACAGALSAVPDEAESD